MERAAQLGRTAHRLLLGAPDDLGHVAQDQHQGVGEEQLVELFLAVEVAEEHPLHDAAQRRDEQRGPQGGEPEAAAVEPDPLHDLERGVGPQHVEGAVREVQHPQHAEDEREPRRDQEEEHRGGEPAEALREHERQIGHRSRSRGWVARSANG